MTVRHVRRPPIVRAVPSDAATVIEASAGTGKTFALEHLVVDLLLSGRASLREVLVVTFTEKATSELRTRVRAKLEELHRGAGQPATAEEIARGDAWRVDARAEQHLAAALQVFDTATIATIHAFCHRVLRENAFESGRLFDEQQVDGRHAFGRAFRDVLRKEIACDPELGPWLEVALERGMPLAAVEKLLWDCASERGELRPALDARALRRAAREFSSGHFDPEDLRARLRERKVHGSTAKSVVVRLEKLFAIAEQTQFATGPIGLARFVADVEAEFQVPNHASLRDPLVAPLVTAATALLERTPPLKAALVQLFLPKVQDRLRATKRETGRYDFDDMLTLVRDALEGPRGTALSDALRRRYRVALIDEFQDTDETQWSIFRRALLDRRGSERPGTLVLVGDPKQSIYRFRGADVETYLAARDAIARDRGTQLRLDLNFRSTPALAEATNAIFEPAADNPVFTGKVTYTPVACGRASRSLVDGDGNPVSPVHVVRFATTTYLDTFGEHIAREVRVMTDPRRPYRFDGRALRPSDIFVLTPKAAEGRALAAVLRRGAIPHAFYKEEGLFQTADAADVHSLLCAIADPSRVPRRLKAWLTCFFQLSITELEAARGVPDTHPLVDRLYRWKTLADEREFDLLFESIVRESGVARRAIFFGGGERSLTNVLHILEFLLRRARASHMTLAELTSELFGLMSETRMPAELEGDVQRLESDEHAVQVMTIHKAKGLEAPVVFVAGHGGSSAQDVSVYHDAGQRAAWVGNAKACPDKQAIDRGVREEKERLMYVALTRAMGRLVLPCVTDPRPRQDGPYALVNRRLIALLEEGRPGFTSEDAVGVHAAVAPESAPAQRAKDWRPPESLLQSVDGAPYGLLRARHTGPVFTSYTRMQARGGGAGPGRERAESAADVPGRDDELGSAPSDLRGARSSGIFLHEVLERVPLASFEVASYEAWRDRADVRALFDETIDVHGVVTTQRAHAERMVFAAFTTPVRLPTGEALPGLATAPQTAREMPFVFTTGREAPFAYVRGALDFTFAWQDRTYFVDWKSDSLASYGPGEVRMHVESHYEEQSKLYAIALVKLLGIETSDEYERRFGGLLYWFLRGADDAGRGVFGARPSWVALTTWMEELRAGRRWAGAPGT